METIAVLVIFTALYISVSLTIFRSMKTSTPMSAAAGEWRDKTRRPPLLTPVGEEQGLSPVLRAAATSRDAAKKSRDQSPAAGARQEAAAEGFMSPVRRIAARETVNSEAKSRVHRYHKVFVWPSFVHTQLIKAFHFN
jgi:hypothetical protein